MSSSRLADAASAANRFGLGARPGSIEAMHDPRGALAQQVRAPPSNDALFAGLTRSADYLAAENSFDLERRERRQDRVAAKDAGASAAGVDPARQAGDGFREQFGEQLIAEGNARWNAALGAPIGFDERIVRFWSNHFAVSVDKRQALLYAAPMEREVIRPLAFGHFSDLLLGVETHPAMLRYLDNAASIGPDSRVGERVAQFGGGGAQQPKRKLGLNENLAREILELHTLGVNGGYTQADVTEFARAITGWSVRAPRDDRGGGLFAASYSNSATGFVYRDNAHEPGARTILGKRYAEGGMEQGRAVLADLALHPATAKHLSLKLAQHFVSDQPPPKLLQRMAVAYLDGGGDLRTLYSTMLDSDEAWAPDARKFRAPDDFLIASLRALGVEQVPDVRKLAGLLGRLGRPDFLPRSPAGFADTADAWIGPDALLKRIQAAEELAARAPRSLVPAQVARDALGPRLRADTAQAIARADSPQQALELLFGSPDFQWRTDMTTRRELLRAMAVGAVTLTLWPRTAWSSSPSSASPLLLVVMLRGGLDGLHALPPMGDNAWGALRGSLPFAPGDNSAKPIAIDRDFALHPSLQYAAELYRQKAFMPVVAIAPPYQGRSHFEAQDCVENGSSRPSGAQDGWMNRCVASLRGEEGLALATAMPLIMRGPAKVSTWSPPLPTGVDPNLVQRLDTLYAEDPQLAEAWSQAVAESHDDATLDVDASMTAKVATADKASGKAILNPGRAQVAYGGGLPAMMAAAGKFMASDSGPQIAFVEDTGWDTHAAEVATLQRKLGQLDAGLKGYREAMGAAWDRAAVVIVTEFGRTARINGTGGTDHGTGGVAFLAGGAIAGGRIAGQWPGLSSQDLNEGRDVHATTDMRALFKGLLAAHLRVPHDALDTQVFPDSAAVRPMDGLLGTGAMRAARVA